MLVVQEAHDEPGTLELRYMFLPLFIAQNGAMLTELKKALVEAFPPPLQYEASSAQTGIFLDIHNFVLDWLQERHGIVGLREYLDGIQHIQES